MPQSKPPLPQTVLERIWHGLLGRARDPHDPDLGHKLSLIAFLAWVGLGMDGLSSSAYGPEEAFRSLGHHTYLAVFLALATAITVFVISWSYSKIIEHFPHGGGGYVVATQILGKPAGIISGCALLVDYVLTITVSIASGGDAVFSLLPVYFHGFKLPLEFLAIALLIVSNLRGVKESVTALVPFFILFIITHILLIFGATAVHLMDLPAIISTTHAGLNNGIAEVGKWGLFVIFLRAYSMGGGTYTGIEAVSNGVATLREPRVETGKRTMLYLSVSLAITAGGLLFCYMITRVKPIEGSTLNYALALQFMGGWKLGSIPFGYWLVIVTIASESILLLVAAQTGFIDGPRVMANMAVDSWLPRRFASLSDRLTMQNGIVLMGVAAMAILAYTRGQIALLVVMYSINVFITFSLSQSAMMKFWIKSRHVQKKWKRNLVIHFIGFVLCFAILVVMIVEKFTHGAWATIVITSVAIGFCVLIRGHYSKVGKRVKNIEKRIKEAPFMSEADAHGPSSKPVPDFDATKPIAAILVGGYSRLGRRNLLAVLRFFPNTFHGIVFISVGVINSEFFSGGSNIEGLQTRTEETLKTYVEFARRLGIPAKFAYRMGTDVVREASQLALETAQTYPHAIFFAGEVVFEHPKWFHSMLHNETAYAIQRQIRFAGLPMVILPLVLHDTPEIKVPK
jgi:amino acid transporter